LKLGTNFQILR